MSSRKTKISVIVGVIGGLLLLCCCCTIFSIIISPDISKKPTQVQDAARTITVSLPTETSIPPSATLTAIQINEPTLTETITRTPEPATITPEPATITPKPATVTPKPATITPKPATVTPKPATAKPSPTNKVGSNCDPSYPTVCIPPPPPDLDCKDIPYRKFQVLSPDPHRFDSDHDGIGCES